MHKSSCFNCKRPSFFFLSSCTVSAFPPLCLCVSHLTLSYSRLFFLLHSSFNKQRIPSSFSSSSSSSPSCLVPFFSSISAFVPFPLIPLLSFPSAPHILHHPLLPPSTHLQITFAIMGCCGSKHAHQEEVHTQPNCTILYQRLIHPMQQTTNKHPPTPVSHFAPFAKTCTNSAFRFRNTRTVFIL